MNNSILLLVIAAIVFSASRRRSSAIPPGRMAFVFGAVVMMHLFIIGGLIAFSHYRHF